MGREGCDRLADLLVDYADGELPEPDRRRVADHLASCADCRAERELLSRSLELARSVWQEAAAEAAAPCPPVTAGEGSPTRVSHYSGMFGHSVPLLRRSSVLLNSVALLALRQAVARGGEKCGLRSLRRVAAVAACAVVVLAAVGSWLAWRPRGGGETASVQQAGASGGPEESAVKPSPAGETAPEEDLDVEAILAREQRAARLAATVALLATEPSLKEYKDRAERYLLETYPAAAFARPAQPPGKLPVKEPRS